MRTQKMTTPIVLIVIAASIYFGLVNWTGAQEPNGNENTQFIKFVDISKILHECNKEPLEGNLIKIKSKYSADILELESKIIEIEDRFELMFKNSNTYVVYYSKYIQLISELKMKKELLNIETRTAVEGFYENLLRKIYRICYLLIKENKYLAIYNVSKINFDKFCNPTPKSGGFPSPSLLGEYHDKLNESRFIYTEENDITELVMKELGMG